MSNKKFYTPPSNKIINIIKVNHHYSNKVKDGLIKLYTLDNEASNVLIRGYKEIFNNLRRSNNIVDFIIDKIIVFNLKTCFPNWKTDEDEKKGAIALVISFCTNDKTNNILVPEIEYFEKAIMVQFVGIFTRENGQEEEFDYRFGSFCNASGTENNYIQSI